MYSMFFYNTIHAGLNPVRQRMDLPSSEVSNAAAAASASVSAAAAAFLAAYLAAFF